MGSPIWSQNWPISSHQVLNNIKTPIQKWDLEESIKIINSETIFDVLPTLVYVSVCSCSCVSDCLCEWTYICMHSNLYRNCECVWGGEEDEKFIAKGVGISTRHLFLKKKKSFLPLTRQVKRVSYNISFNIFISIF